MFFNNDIPVSGFFRQTANDARQFRRRARLSMNRSAGHGLRELQWRNERRLIGPLKKAEDFMYVDIHSALALISGILILIRPALLNYIIALYLILIGILGIVK
jgi:hypothetical protein